MAKKKKRTRFKWLLKRHFCAGAGLWMNVNGKSWNNSGKRMSPTHRGRRETEKKTEKEVKRRRRFQKKKKKKMKKKKKNRPFGDNFTFSFFLLLNSTLAGSELLWGSGKVSTE